MEGFFTALLAGVVAWGIGLFLLPCVIAGHRRLGWLDRGGGGRRMHSEAIPTSGGLGVFAVLLLGVFFALALSPALIAVLGGSATPVQAPVGTGSEAFPSTEQITEQIAGQDPEQDAGQGPEQIAGQDPEQIAGQDPEQIAGQDPEQIAGQDPEQIAGQDAEQGRGTIPWELSLLLWGAAAGLVGWMDDISPQSAGGKSLLLTALSLGHLYTSGFLDGIGGLGGALAAFGGLFWLLLVVNAFNFIDGIDGLAASCGAILAVSLGLSAGLLAGASDDPAAAFALAGSLAGALAAFFFYNKAPARLFLGNAGADAVGFLLGGLSLPLLFPVGERALSLPRALSWGALFLRLAAVLIMLAYPLTDALFALSRRVARKMPFWQGDREHIHHRLAARYGVAAATRRLFFFVFASCLFGMFLLSAADGRFSGFL